MPGVDLNLDLPSLSDPFSTTLSKIITALSSIEDDLAAQVVSSEINVNAALSMNGSALTNAGSVQLVSGNAPSTAGSIWYADGEFFCRDATGTVQLTSAGALDASSIGGITSLASPAAVTWDLASQEFRFTADSGVYADLVADDLVLHSASGSVTISVDNAITSTRALNIKDLPVSGVSALVYKASGSTLESAENTRVTNDFKITTLDATSDATVGGDLDVTGSTAVGDDLTVGGDLEVTGEFYHGDREITLPPYEGKVNADPSDAVSTDAYSLGWIDLGLTDPSTYTYKMHIPLRKGARITSVSCVYQNGNGNGVPETNKYAQIGVFKLAAGGVVTQPGSYNTLPGGTSNNASGTITSAVGSPTAIAANELWYVGITIPANRRHSITLSMFRVFYDAPAP